MKKVLTISLMTAILATRGFSTSCSGDINADITATSSNSLTICDDATLCQNKTITIESDATATICEGKTLTNCGNIVMNYEKDKTTGIFPSDGGTIENISEQMRVPNFDGNGTTYYVYSDTTSDNVTGDITKTGTFFYSTENVYSASKPTKLQGLRYRSYYSDPTYCLECVKKFTAADVFNDFGQIDTHNVVKVPGTDGIEIGNMTLYAYYFNPQLEVNGNNYSAPVIIYSSNSDLPSKIYYISIWDEGFSFIDTAYNTRSAEYFGILCYNPCVCIDPTSNTNMFQQGTFFYNEQYNTYNNIYPVTTNSKIQINGEIECPCFYQYGDYALEDEEGRTFEGDLEGKTPCQIKTNQQHFVGKMLDDMKLAPITCKDETFGQNMLSVTSTETLKDYFDSFGVSFKSADGTSDTSFTIDTTGSANSQLAVLKGAGEGDAILIDQNIAAEEAGTICASLHNIDQNNAPEFFGDNTLTLSGYNRCLTNATMKIPVEIAGADAMPYGATFNKSLDINADVEIPTDETITANDDLTICAGKTLTANNSLTVGGTLNAQGTLTLADAKNLNAGNLQLACDFAIPENSTVNVTGNMTTKDLTADGTLTAGGNITADGDFVASKAFNLVAGKTLQANSLTLGQNFTFNEGSKITVAKGLEAKGAFDLTNGTLCSDNADVTVCGTLTLSSAKNLKANSLTLGQDHTLAEGSTITVTKGLEAKGAFDLTNGTLCSDNADVTVCGTLTLPSGKLQANSLTLGKDHTLANGSTITVAKKLEAQKALDLTNGTLCSDNADVTVCGTLTLPSAKNLKANSLTLGQDHTLAEGSTITVAKKLEAQKALDLTNGTLEAANADVTVCGTLTLPSGKLQANSLTLGSNYTIAEGSTVNVTGNITTKGLTIDGTLTAGGDITADGNFVANKAFTLTNGKNMTAKKLTLGCDLTVDKRSTLTVDEELTVKEKLILNGTLEAENAAVIMCKEFELPNLKTMKVKSLDLACPFTICSGSAVTVTDILRAKNFIANGAFDFSSGKTLNADNLTLSSNFITAAGSTVNVANDMTAKGALTSQGTLNTDNLTADGTFDICSGSTVTVDDTLTTNGTLIAQGTLTAKDITADGKIELAAGASVTVTGTLTANGILDARQGTLNVANAKLEAGGKLLLPENSILKLNSLNLACPFTICSGSALTVTDTLKAKDFIADGAFDFSKGTTLNADNLTLSSNFITAAGSTVNVANDMTAKGALTSQGTLNTDNLTADGTFDICSGSTVTVDDTLTTNGALIAQGTLNAKNITADGKIKLSEGSTVTVDGTLTANGILDASQGTLDTEGATIITNGAFYLPASNTLKAKSLTLGQNYAVPEGATFNLEKLTANGDLDLTEQTLTDANTEVTVKGDLTLPDNQDLTAKSLTLDQDFAINDGSTVTVSDALTAEKDLDLTNGTLSAENADLTVKGALTLPNEKDLTAKSLTLNNDFNIGKDSTVTVKNGMNITENKKVSVAGNIIFG